MLKYAVIYLMSLTENTIFSPTTYFEPIKLPNVTDAKRMTPREKLIWFAL